MRICSIIFLCSALNYLGEFPLQSSSPYQRSHNSSLKGPLRAARLCLLGILIPSMLLSVPLYLRYRVFTHQLYPLAASDMRMLESRVSTIWCQRQKVKVNATFNAFLLPSAPELSLERKQVSMLREMTLEDDTKEYWGFYLLKGSSVTVSTCVRWPGASLIVIRGHKHLHECAYIGDDSSEELDELMEAIREGTYIDPNNTIIANKSKNHGPANQPDMMIRHRPDVTFLSSVHNNITAKRLKLDYRDDNSEMIDPNAMIKLLGALQDAKSHRHRNSTFADGEKRNFVIQPPKNLSASEEALSDILAKLRGMGEKGGQVLEKVIEKFNKSRSDDENFMDTMGRHYSKPPVTYSDYIDHVGRRKRDLILSTALRLNKDDEENNQGLEQGFTADGIADHRGTINETTVNDMSNSEYWSSFSSSEEALLNCAGLILNLPLTPHSECNPSINEEESYRENTVTYRVPTNGYYFFVFNSENEIQPNYIRVKFNLDKVMYNVSNSVANCTNTSNSCALDLKFFSSEKLVMELPIDGNNTFWNEELIVVSECEPRTAIYAVCMLLVPVLVVLFAFA